MKFLIRKAQRCFMKGVICKLSHISGPEGGWGSEDTGLTW